MAPLLDERTRRLWAAAESVAIGYGGDALVPAATGLARATIRTGRRELARGVEATVNRTPNFPPIRTLIFPPPRWLRFFLPLVVLAERELVAGPVEPVGGAS